MVVDVLKYISDYIRNKNSFDIFNSLPNEDKFSFTLGGDFEGLILKPHKRGYIAAKETKFNSTSPTAWVGKDGCGKQVEFRFPPSHYPHNVIINYEKSLNIFKGWVMEGNSGGLVFGYYRFSQTMGGHIHFGKKQNKDLISKLDYYLAVPILMISNSKELKSRCKSNYGKLSATENKSYGFEYRTLGSFAVNKDLATEIYVLAGLIADMHESFSYPIIDDTFKTKYYNGEKSYFTENHIAFIENEILRVASERFGNWGWAFVQILNFLNRVDQKKVLISSSKDVLQMWELTLDYFRLKFKIQVNPDDFLEGLTNRLLSNIENSVCLDEDLFIYGVKQARSSEDVEIWLSSLLYDKLMALLGEKMINKYYIKNGQFGKALTFKYSIGLSYQLRKKLYEKPNHKKSINWLGIIREVITKCVV